MTSFVAKNYFWVLGLVVAILNPGLPLYGASLVVDVVVPPQANTVANGNSYAAPFDWVGRFQQVYDSSTFSSAPFFTGGRGFIRAVGFRVDAIDGHYLYSSLPSIQLNLSTTPKAVDGLSSVFSENVGSDDSVVLGPESVFIAASSGGFFSFWFDFHDNPYFYDSSKGNLLVDFRIHQGFTPQWYWAESILDAFDAPGDSISSVHASQWLGPLTLTNGQVSTLGLATDFICDAIPKMNISVQSTNVEIRWLISSRGDYKLEQTSVLGVDARWQPVAGTVITNSSQISASVILPLEAVSGRFFRLAWQTSSSNAAGLSPNIGSSALITVPNKER